MTLPESQPDELPTPIPTARVLSVNQVHLLHRQTRLWWMTGLCIAIAVGSLIWSFLRQGESIRIRFTDGHGLKVGDTMRYRGIDVGQVLRVNIADDLQGVAVEVRLDVGAQSFAVEGSQFWIERPRLRLGQASGLDTVLGAKYINTIPGAQPGVRCKSFVGLESPVQLTGTDFLDVRIRFPAGEGLAAGDPVKYLKLTIGEVLGVDLSDDLEYVSVQVRLSGAAKSLARRGPQFWIERPRLDLTEVRGLETLVSGPFIAVQPTTQPSASDGPALLDFVGLPEPPPLARRDGTLEVQLDSPSRFGLTRGAPVMYRGLEVGRVANVGLSHDGATISVQVIVEPEYAELVRDNSQWWVSGGIKFEAGITGLGLSIDSLSAWLRGGITFATPDTPGARVVTGHTFELHATPEANWTAWQPRIAIGEFARANGQRFTLPKPIRVAASWNSAWLGFSRRRSVQSWAMPIDDRTLWLPSKFANDAEQAGAIVTIEIEGSSFECELPAILRIGELARINLPANIKVATWPRVSFANSWSSKTPLLIVNPELAEPIAMDPVRLRSSGGVLNIAGEVPLAAGLAGSPVLDSGTGNVIGLLIESSGGWAVAPPP